MPRPAVAAVVGFTRRPHLLAKSFAPLRRLKQAGVLDRILYVTWDRPDLDPWVGEAADMPEVELVRIPEPKVSGPGYQKKHFYQTHNIAAALSLIPDDDTLVLKLRPDQVIDEQFLAAKIMSFEYTCAPSQMTGCLGVTMPKSPFRMKVWTPWADANQPFFMEDGMFAALRCDALKLVQPAGDEIVRQFGDERSLWITNVARYIVPFLNDFHIFAHYLKNFHVFVQNNEYRYEQLTAVLSGAYFWHLVIANAWILANSFHVDAGHDGQILFYPPEGMAAGEDKWSGSPIEAIQPRAPFDKIDEWRHGEKPGSILPCINRIYGRLMDDSWQRALFERPVADFKTESLQSILNNIANYRSGILDSLEGKFYDTLGQIFRRYFPEDAKSAARKSAA